MSGHAAAPSGGAGGTNLLHPDVAGNTLRAKMGPVLLARLPLGEAAHAAVRRTHDRECMVDLGEGEWSLRIERRVAAGVWDLGFGV